MVLQYDIFCREGIRTRLRKGVQRGAG
jgi:hypothetical protein